MKSSAFSVNIVYNWQGVLQGGLEEQAKLGNLRD